jgi:hypothetical protein
MRVSRSGWSPPGGVGAENPDTSFDPHVFVYEVAKLSSSAAAGWPPGRAGSVWSAGGC